MCLKLQKFQEFMKLFNLSEVNKEKFFQLVKDLRKKRAQCIQTEIQYLYLSRVLTEYALSSGEPLSDDVRRAAESFLKEYDSKIKK